jgi:hypothetical protein
MNTRRGFLATLLALPPLSWLTGKATATPDGPLRRKGWMCLPEDEYNRLVSASNPVRVRSNVLMSRRIHANALGKDPQASYLVMCHSFALDLAEARDREEHPIDMDHPDLFIEFRLVERSSLRPAD